VTRWVYAVHRGGPAPDSPAGEMSKAAHALELRSALLGIEGTRVLSGVDEITVDLPAMPESLATRLSDLFAQPGVLEFVPVSDDEAKAHALADALAAAPDAAARGVHVETDVWFAPETHKQHKLPHLAAPDRATLEAVLTEIGAKDAVAPYGVAVGQEPPSGAAAGPGWRSYILITKQGLLDPEVVRADYETSRTASQPQVTVEFSKETAKRFADLTRRHLGQKIAIVVDGEVESAPIVQEPILNGKAILSMGRDTPKDATDLAVLLASGRLPYPIERTSVVDKRTGRTKAAPEPGG
jgi:preprotein translocase subunit SecD